MLQPRLNGWFPRMAVRCICLLLLSTTVSCQEIYDDESIELARVKRQGIPENRDLTVLLVNQKRNDYNTKVGRYHSVKPLIGLLTSTARTFIQDGVTTEFATQILGTTLDNGRIYAQLLTKSSLVLYNKPSNVEEPVIVKPTRVHSVFDGQWNVKQDLGFIDPEQFVLKNTDYLAPNSKMEIVYASKPAQENIKIWNSPFTPESQVENQVFEEPTPRRVQPVKEIPRYVQHEAYNFLDGPTMESEKKFEFIVAPSVSHNLNVPMRQSKAYEPKKEPMVETDADVLDEINIVKIKPNFDLPTFTIKNEFSPIFYYIDNVESRLPQSQAATQQTKLPKKLFGQKSEPRPKKTFTYEGFADFTTVVGDTVIIFTPNTETSRPQSSDEVNIFPSAKRVDKLATKITFLSADIPVATSTYKAHVVNTASEITSPSFSSSEENRSEKSSMDDEDSLKKLLYEVDDKIPDSINIQYSNEFDLNVDVIQPSESPVITTESTQLTDDLGVIPIQQDYNVQATDPLTVLKPTSTIIDTPTEAVVTVKDISEIFVNSEEESENTAAEITEKPKEENEDEEEEEEEEKEETDTEMSAEIMTTTESGYSEESSEEIETTTESKHTTTANEKKEIHDEHETQELHDNHEMHEDVFCTDGLETQSTMTTAYKTLTYLTTYFIPLESTESTTTSIKSDVVVESNVGYLTNVVCRTSFDIEPTAVVHVDVNYSVHTSSGIQNDEERPIAKPSLDVETTTEQAPKTTEPGELQTTILEEEERKTTAQDIKYDESEDEANKEVTTTTNAITTTTEQTTTTENHIDVSVSTEHSTVATEKTKPQEQDSIEDQENEIDVIYKTLYTTYTYFTTFFGDQTSSVASHKSIVTNIITSTIDIANLDPSLLGAFNEDEIAPTSVDTGHASESSAINSVINLYKNKDVIESVEVDDVYSSQTPTPSLGDDIIASIKPDAVKTYYTTYTFFTTIFVGTDANVCSRSELYTNYAGPDVLAPTTSNPLTVESTRAQFDFRNCKQVKIEQPVNPGEHSSMESSISIDEPDIEHTESTPEPSPIEVDMLFSVESNPLESENSYVTDVKSSSSRGERQYLENNNVLDDQISSESNIDEILPSPTLLLQTSYTTFTYFTTMYIGKDSSKVKSHLETITNVVTETIMPNKEPEEESNLPITYYTTFTYWTTLYKDKSTTITSREEIVSNVVTPSIQSVPTVSPIDTTPIEVDNVLPPKDLEVEIKPSLIDDTLDQDDGKATFYTTYTYFTTFYTGNTSQIRSSLETVTNIVDNTKLVEDNQLGRKVPSGSVDKNLIQDNIEKSFITPTVVKEEIKSTQIPDMASASPTVLLGTYIDNLFAEVKPPTPATENDKRILFSQVAVISGDSTIVTSDNKPLITDGNTTSTTTSTTSTTTTSTEGTIISSSENIIESSLGEFETTTESRFEEEDDGTNTRKKSRLTFTPKKPSVTPVITPFSSRNRPTFIPKRVGLSVGATTITRQDVTPTITATPTLKSVRPSGFGGSRKPSAFAGSSSVSKRFSGRSSISSISGNIPSASRGGSFARGSISPSSRRTGFRSSSLRSNSLDYISRSAVPRIRPTASSRLPPGRSIRQSASITFAPADQYDTETFGTQAEESVTEPMEEITEPPARTTNNPLLRFRRPPILRQPGTAIIPRSTTPSSRRAVTPRSRLTTTTKRSTTRSTANPLLALRRQRPNSLFPRRNLFKQPDPEPVEEIKEEEQNVEDNDEILEEEDYQEDNDYDSSDRKERQVASPPTAKKNIVQIRPFTFRRRTKRQVDYPNRKYTNFRRPGTKSPSNRKSEPEPETEAPPPAKPRSSGRFSSRLSTNGKSNTRTTTSSAPKASSPKASSARQPFIVRGESRTTSTTPTPAYRRGKSRPPPSRSTTTASRPKAPRLSGKSATERTRPSTSRTTTRARPRTTTSRASSRQRNSFENISGERFNYNNVINDGKLTITHQIPTEVTIPFVNGKITEYKNVLSATSSLETVPINQVSTVVGTLGQPQLVLISESTELADNGATKIIKFLLHETPTTTVIFTPTTIRGRKTSYSHVLPSTVYSVEPVTQTIAPEINPNVPLANLLLSQLLLGNQQPAINPLLALQGQGLLPQQPIVQTPVTEFKTRATTYVTTVTDARETVLPITFRGIPILTTIIDPTTNVITATEFVTETIITTPTALAAGPQLNSLLLPLLLQQQQQQQQASNPLLSLQQTQNPLLGLGQTDLKTLGGLNNLNNFNSQNNLNNDIYSNSPKPNILSDLNSNEDFSEDNIDTEDDAPPQPTPTRGRNKPKNGKPPPPPKLTSVVTLYVSGKHPGEFSTVLSTVVTDDTQTVRKREAIYYEDVQVSPSVLPTVDEIYSSQMDSSLNALLTDTGSYTDNSSLENQLETQSLESIVGEVSKHIRYDASPTLVLELASPTSISNHKQSLLDDVS